MLQEYDVVKVVRVRSKHYSHHSGHFVRTPRIGDIGTIVHIAENNQTTGYFVECIGPNGSTIWLDDFTADELVLSSVDNLATFSPGTAAEAPDPKWIEYLDRLRAKVVEIAQSMLEGQTGILVGARQLTQHLPDIIADEADPDLLAFVVIVSETDSLPVGAERQYWSESALREKDQAIFRAEEIYRKEALASCKSLIARFR